MILPAHDDFVQLILGEGKGPVPCHIKSVRHISDSYFIFFDKYDVGDYVCCALKWSPTSAVLWTAARRSVGRSFVRCGAVGPLLKVTFLR